MGFCTFLYLHLYPLSTVHSVGSNNKEFSFRHDWNSLISDDSALQMKYYTTEYFPQADDYVCLVTLCISYCSQS